MKMNKKKSLWFGGFTVLVLIIGVASVSASGFNLSSFKKTEGVKQVQEGVLVDLPTKKDKQDIINSIDPVTGAPTLQSKAKAKDRNVLSKSFVADDTRKTLDVPYVKENDKEVAIYDPVTTLWTVPIPGTNEYLISFDGTIYRTDWKNGKLEKFLKDEVNGYKKDETLSKQVEGIGTPLWGSAPAVSPTGAYVLFFSERSMVNGEDKNGQLWIKNIKTGDEQPVLSGGAGVIGWLNNETVILDSQHIISLNVETAKAEILIEDGTINAALLKDQLVYQINPGSLTLQSIQTGKKTEVPSLLINRVASLQSHGSWVALHNQEKDGEPDFSVVLYNVDEKTWKVIHAPPNTWIDGVSWMDSTTLLIQTSVKGTLDEATYTVNIDEVEVAK
ncbi:hypothetical protein [Paenibacillus sp. YN15]|uniref:hypothetical protein n=1 Tax=Paenibacillus sp. YN15 TaxID=1742774 RepID=UPI000DCCC2DB|nr:hypothetical protein [Paenibacillus sp. YN15]RAV06447.1 hypothetical protein DQG13_01020 [Paenibacillus sp. YN15]